MTARLAREIRGQVAILLVGGLMAVGAGAVVLGAFAAGVGGRDTAQRAADLGALAGARAMHDAYDRLFEPARLGGRPNPRHLDKPAYVALGRAAAIRVARANGAARAEIGFPDADTIAPVRIRVDVRRRIAIGGTGITAHADAEAELAPPAGAGEPPFATGGGLQRPARLPPGEADATGRRAGVRPDGESGGRRRRRAGDRQRVPLGRRAGGAVRAAPGSEVGRAPGHVAAPQRHRARPRPGGGLPVAGGERAAVPLRAALQLGTLALRLRAQPALGAARDRRAHGGDGERAGGLPDFVPQRFAPAINAAAQRWSVSAVLLSAQLYAESGFNPFATSPAGAQGIAQFMPATARGMGLADPFDPDRRSTRRRT